MSKNIKFALVGATGLVGRTVIKVLEEFKLPISNYSFFASEKSAGKKITFLEKDYFIEELTSTSFNSNFDFAIFCAGSDISKKHAPIANSNGCIVIDNSNAFRMDYDVPLIVPEVNSNCIFDHHGIISNPNCSTIQAVVALNPLDELFSIKRIVYSTYQAVSGAGQKGLEDFYNCLQGFPPNKFPHPIYNNCLPHIDEFLDNGYTKEEEKMINETRKILNKPNLPITATTVRVPVTNCHCESINIELEKDFDLSDVKRILSSSNGIILQDDIYNDIYPLPTNANNTNNVYVGRIRRDFSVKYRFKYMGCC